MQKTLRDGELESLQGKVQKLEKLCRALQTERNELSKKVQCMSSPGPAPGPQATDSDEGSPRVLSSPDPETSPAHAAGPPPCHCGPEGVSEACALPAQE